MAELTLQAITATGLEPVYSAVSASDTVKVNTAQRNFLHVKNGSGGSVNVTIEAVKTSARVPGVGVVTVGDLVVAVPAAEERMIGPITEAYLEPDGEATVKFSGTASVTAAAISLPAAY